MRYGVWSGEDLLGESELEMPPSARGDRMGIFLPAPAFERVAPVFRRRQELVGKLAELALTRPREAEPAEAMRKLLAETGLGAELRESHAALAAIHVDVRDATGAALAPREVNIFDVRLLEPIGAPEELREGIRAELADLGLDPAGPHWLLQVLPRTEEPRAEDGWEPERGVA